MLRSRKRLLYLIATLPALLVAVALLYMAGMSFFEGESRGFWHAFEWAGETLSSTGYGRDDAWRHPLMILFVVVTQFTGVFLVFLVFPVYLIPFLEERFETKLPTSIKEHDGHLVIYRYGAAVEGLVREAGAAGVDTVIIETDAGRARSLFERGHTVLLGSLEDEVLERAHLQTARFLVANGPDEEDAAVILAARQLGFEGEILALVEAPFHRQPILMAGASAVFTPRHVLGDALAARASRKVQPTMEGAHRLGDRLLLREARIAKDSALAGKTLAEAGIGQQTGVTVVGQWVGGELQTQPTAGMRIAPDGILILAGSEESLIRFEQHGEAGSLDRGGPFIVAGFGEVGRRVVELLRLVDEPVQVIDREGHEGVDVVGDVLDPEILAQVDFASAKGLILALDTDAATLFATVVSKEAGPQVPVIARVNRSENLDRIHRAGADFALSIAEVSGQILARHVLGQEAVAVGARLKVQKVSAGSLVGRHPRELDIRQRTGCSVVAVERGEELIVEFDDSFRFNSGDAVYICGDREAVRAFRWSGGEN